MDNWYALLGSLPGILVEGKVRATAPAIVGWLVFFGEGAFMALFRFCGYGDARATRFYFSCPCLTFP